MIYFQSWISSACGLFLRVLLCLSWSSAPVFSSGEKPDTSQGPGELPKFAIQRLGTATLRHGHEIDQVAISPQGRWLASSTFANSIWLWDAKTGKALRKYPGAGTSLTFSTDGNLLASGTGSGGIYVRDIVRQKGTFEKRNAHRRNVRALAFSPDSKFLVSADLNGQAKVWNLKTNRLQQELKADLSRIHSITFAPDGKTLALGSNQDLYLWQVPSWKFLTKLEAHKGTVLALAFTNDSKTLASGGTDTTIKLWSVSEAKLLRSIQGSRRSIRALVFPPDGSRLVVESLDKYVRIWNPHSAECLVEWKNDAFHGKFGFAKSRPLCVTPLGRVLQVWDYSKRSLIGAQEGHLSSVKGVKFIPGKQQLLSTSEVGEVRLWDIRTGKMMKSMSPLQRSITSFATSGSTKLMACCDSNGVVRVWSIPEAKMLAKKSLPIGAEIVALDFTKDDKGIILATSNGLVVWSFSSDETSFRSQGKNISSIAISTDGTRLAWGTSTGAIEIWDLPLGKSYRRLPGHAEKVHHLTFSPDDRMLLSASDDTMICWELYSGHKLHRLQNPFGIITDLCFLPDGKRFAYSSDSSSAYLVGVPSGAILSEFMGHRGPMCSIACSSDGLLVATGSTDTTVLLWDVKAAKSGILRQTHAITPKDCPKLWRQLASVNAGEAYSAIWLFSTNPKITVPFLQSRLQPARELDPKMVRALIGSLSDNRSTVREKAFQQLRDYALLAVDELQKAVKVESSLEARLRLQALLEQTKNIPPKELQKLRAVQVLEYLGGSSGRKLLQQLAQGATRARITQEAKKTLARLERR